MTQKNINSILRILDASLNRAGEGLRVVEDYLRMVLDDRHLAQLAKQLRHDLATAAITIQSTDRHAARNTLGDVGTSNSTTSETTRGNAADVAAASFKRSAEALRTIEEYGKLVNAQLATKCEQLRYRLYTLEKATDFARNSNARLASSSLYVLVEGCETADHFSQLVGQLVESRVGVIQLRDKRLDDSMLLERARQIVSITRGTPTLAIVNDRPDIAVASHADGVHLGQDDLPVAAARSIVGPQMLVGVSTHHIAQARQAVLDGANYLGAGPTFASTTKEFDTFSGLDYLREVASEISLPTFAIGGITPENLPDVLATGVGRVAVSGSVSGASNVPQMIATLNEMLANHTAIPRPSGV